MYLYTYMRGSNTFSLIMLCVRCACVIARSRAPMGSLDPDTRCCYCGINLASYIPDGTAGPMCGDCMCACSFEKLVHMRHQRLIECLIRSCGKTAHVQLKLHRDAHVTVAAFLWRGWAT